MAHSHFAELLDLDAEVLSDFHREVFDWVGKAAGDHPHIVDLGAGAGLGSLALARTLPGATVTAVDMDEEMLTHLRHKASAAGLADRIRTVQADLDQAWPADLPPADLIWASASMHHMADPAAALAKAFALLRPGGVFAVSELDAFPRFLPAGPDAELEHRIHAVMAAMREEAGLHMHEDWSARLESAGFTVEQRHFDIALDPPLPPAAGRYAQVSLERAQHRLTERLSPTDAAALSHLIAAIPTRPDLVVKTTRAVYLAHRS